jgi:hypothetical protein
VCEIITVTPIKNALSRRTGDKPVRTTAKEEWVMTSNTFVGSYKHTQRGTLILAVTLGMALLFAILAMTLLKPLWVAPLILLATAWLFRSLTIEITDRELRWCFGPGLIRKSVPLSEIVSATPVRTNVLEGWGIHLSRYGWLYNVSGFDALAVTLRSGKRFALGTDEPQALVERLAAVIQQNQPAGIKA